MTKFFILFAILFCTNFKLEAHDIPIGYDPKIESEGHLNNRSISFPNFNGFEIVRDGVADPDLVESLHRALNTYVIDSKGRTINQMRWLIVRNLRLLIRTTQPQDVSTPFVVHIRYQQKGDLMTSIVSQGTIFAEGTLSFNQLTKSVSVEINKYSDSQYLEQQGRKWGYIAEYDLSFAKRVAGPILEDFFSKQTNVNQLLKLQQAQTSVAPH